MSTLDARVTSAVEDTVSMAGTVGACEAALSAAHLGASDALTAGRSTLATAVAFKRRALARLAGAHVANRERAAAVVKRQLQEAVEAEVRLGVAEVQAEVAEVEGLLAALASDTGTKVELV